MQSHYFGGQFFVTQISFKLFFHLWLFNLNKNIIKLYLEIYRNLCRKYSVFSLLNKSVEPYKLS